MFNRTIRVTIQQTVTCDVNLVGTNASADNIVEAVNNGRMQIVDVSINKIVTENGHEFEVDFENRDGLIDDIKQKANSLLEEIGRD